ncbi:DUF262 domain-containing protein [Paenibacillus chitinolyticus]|uniref:DUF262 domain-containing protein n=1 Tax=Paenibacillus chitinolyticus TaxID=79263 RepID=UPI0035DA4143
MDTFKNKLTALQKTAKERTVKTQNIEYDLETLVKKVNKNTIKLDPEYQRNHRWSVETSSKLIESLILNIPIPLIYLSQDVDVDTEPEDDVARYSVIDGQQRLTAIIDFMTNQFALTELNVLKDLNDSFYKDLPPFLVRRLEERTIKCLRIDSTVDAQVKYDIFERLNSGSIKLEAQELRNAVYRGSFNNLIKQLSKNEDFRILLQVNLEEPDESNKVKKMEDVELVLRYFSLIDENYLNYKKGFKQFLSSQMEKMNELPEQKLEEMKQRFIKVFRGIREIFGDTAFAKYKKDGDSLKRVSKFNAAVFDALAVSYSECVNIHEPKLSQECAVKYQELFYNEEFNDSVTGSVNDREKIIKRIDYVKQVLCK